MQLSSLQIEGFRNLKSVSMEPAAGVNWLFGVNGAGKTSVLEAIHVLARGRSFRVNNTSALIFEGRKRMRIIAQTQAPEHRIGVERGAAEWTGRIDRQPCAKMSEFARVLPLVLIDPDNHDLIEGSPAARRSFLDWGLFHVEQSYLSDWKRYNRFLRQRNAALRDRATAPLLAALEQSMAGAASTVDDLRQRYVGLLRERLAELQEELGFRIDPVRLDYRSSAQSAREYLDQWRATRERDLDQGFTRDGPHRGELVVRVGDRSAAPRLSRGQMKLVALMLKLAQLRLAGEHASTPLLLLDDPVSELDREHLARLLDWVEKQPNQTWITAVESPERTGFELFHVEQGEIRAVV